MWRDWRIFFVAQIRPYDIHSVVSQENARFVAIRKDESKAPRH
jgi:hypothetical protein